MSTRSGSLPLGRRSCFGVLAVLVAATVVGFGVIATPGDAKVLPDGVTISVTPTADVVDGTKVTVNVKARPDIMIGQLWIKQCKLGVPYDDGNDIQYFNGKCPPSPVSSSADSEIIVSREGAFVLSRTSAGLDVPFRVGSGTTEWAPGSGATSSLTCGPEDPCALVVRVLIAGQYYFSVTRLDFVDADPIAGCGGPDDGVLQSAGSDELADAWARWTREYCTTPGAGGAPSTATFGSGEGPAVSGFSSGLNDIAYTASAYNSDIALQPAGTSTRAAVAVPVAINAVVFATGSGRIATVNGEPVSKVPYSTLKLTQADAAALTGGGVFWAERPDRPYRDSILGLNPELEGSLYYGGGKPDTAGVYAQSTTLSSTWFLTDFLRHRAPDHFTAVGTDFTGTRPATSNFAQAQPTYSNALRLVTGRPSLAKVIDAAALDEFVGGPIWTITDLATAKAFDLGLVALESSPGTFVEPNAQTLAAGVSTLKRDEQGLLVPDTGAAPPPPAVAVQAAVDPYPLTYVVYALVPAEPLVNADCTSRTASQKLLSGWLSFITTNGQTMLPDGLQPLPPALVSEAKSKIELVGTAPVTGSCAGQTGTTGDSSGGSGSLPAGVLPSSLPSSKLPSGPQSLPIATASPPGTASNPSGASDTERIAAVPVFSQHELPDTMGGVVALIGIALVSTLGVFLTARAADGSGAMSGEGGFVVPGGQRTVLSVVILWLLVALASVALVVYQLGPLLQQRDQRSLLEQYRQELRAAAFANEGLPGAAEKSSARKPPEIGEAVGILEIGDIGLRQVTVEGVGPSQTDEGPGHVPGTAALGQPGNSVVIARRNTYGGSFSNVADVRRGTKIVVTTTQGQSVYSVRSVEERELKPGLFGASKDDRLTLVTSATRSPFNSEKAAVVVAVMRDLPFERTAQGARTKDQTSVAGRSDVWPAIALALVVYLAVLASSVFVYRRFRFVVAYALTIAPIVAVTVLFAESLGMLLPSWT